jgi:hypothetical protein
MTQTIPLRKYIRLYIRLTAAITVASLGSAAYGASTGSTTPVAGAYTPQGSGTPSASGDYVTTNNGTGLNTFYRYFIEVPPALARLRIQLWDADIGAGGVGEAAAGRDRGRGNGGTFSTSVTYTLLRPDGSTATTLTCSNAVAAACADNAWVSLLDSSTAQNTAAGHWELRVDESSTVTAGDDINAFGVRADDGDETAAGVELPIYIDSQNEFGVNQAPTTTQISRNYAAYPYFTAGCTAKENDFDYDSNQTDNVGSIAFTSRTGATTQTLVNTVLSKNNVWAQNTILGWTTDSDVTDYGIWLMNLTIKSYNDAGTGLNGNYTTFYVGSSALTAPPPVANPVTNAFRIYLPTDAGTAPVKPYVEQFVRYFSGPNPPTVGNTQRDTVTVRVVNPTTHAITFSATNLVTANVPGTRVLYAGNAQKTQGTIVAQPAVGGSGNITWNPGTVAAGQTVILSWNVDIRPTAGGQRNPAVGTFASGNGTKAVWVDETGNTTQPRATFTFGGLCEVAVTQGTLTEALVSSLRALPADGGTAIEWQTSSEAGTIGFDLYRQSRQDKKGWVKVNPNLLVGLLTAPQGGTYRFVDAGAAPGEEQTYRLVEIDASGRRREHGPFTVRADWTRTAGGSETYTRTAHATRPVEASAPDATTAKTAKTLVGPLPSPLPILGQTDALHLAVRASGLYHLASSDLATAFGMQLGAFNKLIGKGQLALSRSGQPVAWYPDSTGSQYNGIFFYGEAVDSLFTRDNIYRLELTPGLVMTTAPAGVASGTGLTSFTAALHAEQDLLPATSLNLDPASDYWFWDGVQSGDPTYGTRSFPLDAPGALAAGGTASLTVHLEGASASGVAAEHHPSISLNGTLLGDDHFQGITAHDSTFTFNPALLTPTGNQVQVTGLLDAGVPYSLFFIDSFDLAYPRSFGAASGALAFGANGRVSVSGFGDAAVRLLDVSTPTRPRWLTGAAVTADPHGGWDLGFQAAGTARYLAAATAGLRSPVVTPFRTPRLHATSNHADLVIVAGPGLHTSAQRLADYRSAQGLDSMVVDFDEVTDEFAYGVPDPHAIPAFLAFARGSWPRAPRYLVLAGAGTVDYRNLLGYGDNLLPTIFVANEGGLFPSDGQLADIVGNDSLPELAVGRIPAHSSTELDAYVDKVMSYESGADGAWVGSAIALADATDQGAIFADGSDRVATFLTSGYTVDRIYLDTATLSDARSRLLQDLQAGASIVNYIGHGGLDRLSSGGLLASSDVATLTNGPRVPLVTAMTCSINRFAVPGVSSLGELLVDQSGGGAAAVWAPSGLSVHNEAQLLAERFYRHLGDPDGARLGDVILRALRDFQSLGGSTSMIQIYNLLGDPALRVRHPTPGPGGPGSPSKE